MVFEMAEPEVQWVLREEGALVENQMLVEESIGQVCRN